MKTMRLIAIVSLCFAPLVRAQEAVSADKIVQLLPFLTEKDKQAVNADSKFRDLVWSVAKITASQTLAKYGYWTGPFTSKWGPKEATATKTFQSDFGLTPTGFLDSSTISALRTAEEFLFLRSISLPMKVVSGTAEFVSIQGVFRSDNFKDASPLNARMIYCDKQTMTCRESFVNFLSDKSSFLPDHAASVFLWSDEYTILRWTDDLIVAESQALCAKTVLTINRRSEDVTLTRYQTSTGGDCKNLEKGPFFSTLVSGTDVLFDPKWNKFRELWTKRFDPRFLEQFERLSQPPTEN